MVVARQQNKNLRKELPVLHNLVTKSREKRETSHRPLSVATVQCLTSTKGGKAYQCISHDASNK